jgi:hypothetical protein
MNGAKTSFPIQMKLKVYEWILSVGCYQLTEPSLVIDTGFPNQSHHYSNE